MITMEKLTQIAIVNLKHNTWNVIEQTEDKLEAINETLDALNAIESENYYHALTKEELDTYIDAIQDIANQRSEYTELRNFSFDCRVWLDDMDEQLLHLTIHEADWFNLKFVQSDDVEWDKIEKAICERVKAENARQDDLAMAAM